MLIFHPFLLIIIHYLLTLSSFQYWFDTFPSKDLDKNLLRVRRIWSFSNGNNSFEWKSAHYKYDFLAKRIKQRSKIKIKKLSRNIREGMHGYLIINVSLFSANTIYNMVNLRFIEILCQLVGIWSLQGLSRRFTIPWMGSYGLHGRGNIPITRLNIVLLLPSRWSLD